MALLIVNGNHRCHLNKQPPTPGLGRLIQLFKSPTHSHEKVDSPCPPSLGLMIEKLITLRLPLSYFGRQDLIIPGIKTFSWSSHADQFRIIWFILHFVMKKHDSNLWKRGSRGRGWEDCTFSHPRQISYHMENYRKWHLCTGTLCISVSSMYKYQHEDSGLELKIWGL